MALDKNRGASPHPGIEALAMTPAVELRVIWQEQRDTPPPAHLSARIMRLALAWDMQAEEQGGETRATRRQWQVIMTRRVEGANPEAAVNGLAPVPAPEGTRLLKSWAGETHEVIVTDKGAAWNGTTYSSLSAVARAMTGTPRNGPKFFGLWEKAQ